LCSAETGGGCSEKEIKYSTTWKTKSLGDIKKQISRLEGMKAKKMKENLKKWISQRLAILKQLDRKAVKEEL